MNSIESYCTESEIRWMGDVPEGWGAIKLKYLTSCNDESLPDSTEPDEEIHYVDISSVTYPFGITKIDQMSFSDAPSRARRLVKNGDTIVSTVRTYLKAIAPIEDLEQRLIVSTGFAVIRPRDLLPGYLSRLLLSHYFLERIASVSVGVSYPAVNPSDIGNIVAPKPPLAEQFTIAAYLDRETARIDALIQKKERMIELLKEKRVALITQAVTKGLDPKVPMKNSGIEWLGEVPEHWEVKRIKHVATRIQTGCTPPTSKEQYYEDGTIQWFGPSSFTGDLYLSDPVKIINESSVTDGVARLFEEGSVMMVGIGATIGKIAQIKIPSSCNQQITVVTLKRSECDPDYYTYLLKTMETTIRGIAPSATLAIFDQGKIGSLSVLKPPLFEQVQVAEFLSDKLSVLEHMMSTISGSIRLLREYRSSLIHHAVTGKIDLRGYDAKAQ